MIDIKNYINELMLICPRDNQVVGDIICLKTIHSKVRCHFAYNTEKINYWFNTPNPMLGDITPLHLFEIGRVKKLREFVDAALEGY